MLQRAPPDQLAPPDPDDWQPHDTRDLPVKQFVDVRLGAAKVGRHFVRSHYRITRELGGHKYDLVEKQTLFKVCYRCPQIAYAVKAVKTEAVRKAIAAARKLAAVRIGVVLASRLQSLLDENQEHF